MINATEYHRPRTFDELWKTFEDLASPWFISAGCTDLVPKSRSGLLEAGAWVDVRAIPELSELTVTDESIRLGAAVTHHRVATHELIREEMPALTMACGAVGSRQIRALGTLGGNAANCSPCADSLLALIALDAEVVLRTPKGTRTIAAKDFPRGPGESILNPKELIEAFVVPRRQGRKSTFLKLGPRKAVAVAKVSTAVSATIDDAGALHDVRLVMGSVAPTALRIDEVEALLEGKPLDDALLAKVAELTSKAVHPIDDVRSTAEYRRITSGVLAKRAFATFLD